MKKNVTVFGSSVPQPGESEYEIAYHIGSKLARSGFNVCTGGFQGIMDAVSRGAKMNGAEAIGVTLDVYNVKPSSYLTKEIRCHTLFERLAKLIELGDAFIILQGGTGTLVELAIVWEFINKNLIDIKPVAALGKMWKEIVALMEKQIQREKRQLNLVRTFEDADELLDYIVASLKGRR